MTEVIEKQVDQLKIEQPDLPELDTGATLGEVNPTSSQAAKKKKKRKPKKKAASAQNGEKSNADVVKGKPNAYYDVILALNS
jgi:hypothetical protein